MASLTRADSGNDVQKMPPKAQNQKTDVLFRGNTCRRGTLARHLSLACFLAVCVFANREIVPETHLYLSHVVTVIFFVLSVAFWIGRRGLQSLKKFLLVSQSFLLKGRIRRISLKPITITVFVGALLTWRIVTTLDNPFFLGDFSKLLVLVLGIVSYRIVDPDRDSLRLVMWLLPTMIAVAVGISVVGFTLTGDLFEERLAIDSMGSPVAVGYISGTLTAFVLYGSEYIRGRWSAVLWSAVGWTLFVAVVLSFGRNGMLAVGIITLVYAKYTRRRSCWKVALALGAVATVVAAANITVEEFTVAERFGASTSLSGRDEIWGTYLSMTTKDVSTFMLGEGIGSYRPIFESTGGDMRDPHNVYLDVMAIGGVVGLFVYFEVLRRVYVGLKALGDINLRMLLMGLFWAYALTEVFDTHWRQSALLWYTAYLIHLVGGIALRETARRSWRFKFVSRVRLRPGCPHTETG